MRIIHHLTIDLARRLPVPPIGAVQNDASTRAVALALLENGSPWTVPEGITAAVAFRKPDGHKGLYDTLPDGSAAVTIGGSTVTAILAPQVLTCAGAVSAAVVFHDADLNQLATFPFPIRVEKDPAAGQAISNDYYRYTTLAAVNEAMEAAESALQAAQTRLDWLAAATAIVRDAAGSAIAISDGADAPLQGLTLYGKTIQDGTPAPETPIELESVGDGGTVAVTVGGKNLLPNTAASTTILGVDYTVNADGTVTLTGTSTDETAGFLVGQAVLPPGEYIASHGISGGSPQMWLYIDGVRSSGLTFTLTKTSTVSARIYQHGERDYNVTVKPMIRPASVTDDTYEPGKPLQVLTVSTPNGLPGIPVTDGGNYTDENGQQWVCDEVDLARGVYAQRVRTVVFDGTEDITLASAELGLAIDPTTAPTNISTAQGICSHYVCVGRYALLKNRETADYQGCSVSSGYIRFVDNLNYNNDLDGFKAFLAEQYAAGTPVTVKYMLAAPIETALSAEELAEYAALHSNKPNTTVLNDPGAYTALRYVADTKTYIDQKIAAVSAAMLL